MSTEKILVDKIYDREIDYLKQELWFEYALENDEILPERPQLIGSVNDIPIFNKDDDNPGINNRYGSRTINDFVVGGENTFELSVSSMAPDTKVRVRIALHEEGEFPGYFLNNEEPEGVTLAEIVWDSKTEKTDFPLNLKGKLSIKNAPAEWRWENAEVLTLNNKTKQELLSFFDVLYEKHKNKDIDGIFELERIAIEEFAVAFPRYSSLDFEKQKEQFQYSLNNNGGYTLAPVNKDELEFSLVAEGRLVQIMDKEGRSPIRYLPNEPDDEGDSWPQRIFIGKINGEYKVLRGIF
ncbi:hypothetical protein CL654_03020 [bacterium]|nr:hypothetical protein [bacterium]|tara:strand:+ start:5783 stop:6667 length:885 start_codon:yes stop_codon:yes gene_type:complete